MRNSPILHVDPTKIPEAERAQVVDAVERVKDSGTLDFSSLPSAVRDQLLFALEALAHGHQVAAVATGKPLTTSEAAQLLGMSRSYLSRLCDEGRIPSYLHGTARRIDAETVMTILRERSRAREELRHATETRDERRLRHAARVAGLSPA
jgi:excisionase family DNA binding protein